MLLAITDKGTDLMNVLKNIFVSAVCAVLMFSLLAPSISAAEYLPSGIGAYEIGEKIDELAGENEDGYASFAVSVFDDTKTIYSGYYGFSDRENQIYADGNTVYEWGSISKLLVWVSVMQLYEQGKLELDADITTYLPDDFLTKLRYDEPVTMLHLMNHTAGFQETTRELEVENEENIIPLEDALRETEPAQVYRPGEISSYSNWGAALAGYIVERISGMDYAEYVHKNILSPLGMEHTSVGADYTDNLWVREQREKVKSYLILKADGLDTDEALGCNMSFILLYPAGSATGTLDDLTTFAKAFVSDNSPLFENEQTLELMLSCSDYFGDSDIYQNCHGLWPYEYATTVLGHGGNTNSATASLCFDPQSGFGMVVMTNQQSEILFTSEIPKLVFGSFFDNEIYKNAVITTKTDISADYITSRGLVSGQNKLMRAIGYLPLERTENENSFASGGISVMTRISDNIYLIDGTETFLYQSTDSDGNILLESAGNVYIESKSVKAEFISIIIYSALFIVTIVILLIKLTAKLFGKLKKASAGKAILAGQLSTVITGIMTIIIILLFLNDALSVLIGITCSLMAVISAVCAVIIAKALISKNDMKLKSRIKYAVYVLCNLFTSVFIIYFELYNFII